MGSGGKDTVESGGTGATIQSQVIHPTMWDLHRMSWWVVVIQNYLKIQYKDHKKKYERTGWKVGSSSHMKEST